MKLSSAPAMLESRNPATGALARTYEPFTFAEVERILGKVTQAQSGWAQWSLERRQGCFAKLATVCELTHAANAALITRETGKPITQAEAEVDKLIELCKHLAELDHGVLRERVVPIEGGAAMARIRQLPTGVVLLVMPANYPFWQPMRAALPALLAGNAIALKHAASVPDCALTLEALMLQAGFPEDCFRSFLVSGEETPVLIAHPTVNGIAFTGRSELGVRVAGLAAVKLKRASFMLSGNDPCLVLADADISLAARLCAESRMQNGGQACIAAQRMIVVKEVAEAFTAAFVREMERYQIGDPEKAETCLGALTSHKLRDRVHEQVGQSVASGGQLLCGGALPSGPGAFYPATVIGGASAGMPVWDEEIFGPVAGVTVVEDLPAAIAAANDSPMALGASIFSADQAKAAEIGANELTGSMCAVNRICRSYPAVPFGGRQASGLGYELGTEGLLQFTRVQTLFNEA